MFPLIGVVTPYNKKRFKNSIDVRPHLIIDWCGRTLLCLEVKTAKPGSARTLTGLLTTIDSVDNEVAMKEHNTQSQIVILPYVSAVDPESIQLGQWLQETENRLLDRVKAALNEAGVAWIDPRTKERSKPATTDSVEGSDNA
ncbi:hypothetical protein DRK59_23645 [Salmonella enterica subsp. diarizonae]|nr:hypothetical protein [Salmonella enterica subsp. diarizonae]